MYRFRDIYVYVMYYVYVTSGPSLLIESTDSMMKKVKAEYHNVIARPLSLEIRGKFDVI